MRLEIEGMTCGGCARRVRGALEGVDGVTGVDVDVDQGAASVVGEADMDTLVDAVGAAGFAARSLRAP